MLPDFKIRTNPEVRDAFKSVETPRKIFGQGIAAIEKLVALARQMPASDSAGDWGQWFYHRGFGEGGLYVPFGKQGLAAVYLSCGGDIGQDNIAQASFVSAFAVWKSNPSGLKEFTFSLVACPGGQWNQNLGGIEEATLRKFFLFQETSKQMLQLEQLGSQKLGWFEASNLGKNVQVELDNMPIPAELNGLMLIGNLNYKRESGSVNARNILRD